MGAVDRHRPDAGRPGLDLLQPMEGPQGRGSLMGALIAMVGPWLLGKAKSYGLYVLLALAVIGVILAVLGKTKSLGRAEERVQSMQRTIDAVKRKQEIERETHTEL